MKSAWDALFHKSGNRGFERTRAILLELLSKSESFTDAFLLQIIGDFTSACERECLYPWRYYYVKYPSFRPGKYGKYSNSDVASQPYLFSVMQTKLYWSSNTYLPYLKEADDAHLSRESCGQRLVFQDRHIVCRNDAFDLRENKTEEVIKTIPIPQNADGIDTADRILLLKQFLIQIGFGQPAPQPI